MIVERHLQDGANWRGQIPVVAHRTVLGSLPNHRTLPAIPNAHGNPAVTGFGSAGEST